MVYLFLYDRYYPLGGINDLAGEFPSVESARQSAKESDCEKYQITTKDLILVESGYCGSL